MKKIGELNALAGSFIICYDEKEAHNHYKIYHKWYNQGWHKMLVEKYGDLYSCSCWIHNWISQHNEDGR